MGKVTYKVLEGGFFLRTLCEFGVLLDQGVHAFANGQRAGDKPPKKFEEAQNCRTSLAQRGRVIFANLLMWFGLGRMPAALLMWHRTRTPFTSFVLFTLTLRLAASRRANTSFKSARCFFA